MPAELAAKLAAMGVLHHEAAGEVVTAESATEPYLRDISEIGFGRELNHTDDEGLEYLEVFDVEPRDPWVALDATGTDALRGPRP